MFGAAADVADKVTLAASRTATIQTTRISCPFEKVRANSDRAVL